MQHLLLPEVIALTPKEVEALEEEAEAIARLGVELRAVGTASVAVHAVPALLLKASPERIVRELLAEVGRTARRPFSEMADHILATMACHGSVRAGDPLTEVEARALLHALDEVDFANHCPHGRPVVTRLSFRDLELKVGRP
jgi:DNA mismatch repair protein MutL